MRPGRRPQRGQAAAMPSACLIAPLMAGGLMLAALQLAAPAGHAGLALEHLLAGAAPDRGAPRALGHFAFPLPDGALLREGPAQSGAAAMVSSSPVPPYWALETMTADAAASSLQP
ncbi:hypothetical protein EOD42_19175 [Rhodovarius crocodyli]|uniref:Uncharacterized protein n=1 Tax=Rhodovarius crocodyli TaxID=1979269 RepID=A0A437M442_9PROT|nr:hypothetical protein [Rhodovarius crocodyli]RVT92333.1 hypothetical protein EOD42_19175 [Rhodovarius crocodyli]